MLTILAMLALAGDPQTHAARIAPAPPARRKAHRPAHKTQAPGSAIHASEWERTPTGEELGRLFPRSALKEGIEGRTVMECVVTDTGALSLCVIASEYPLGRGFGDASLKSAPLFRLKTTQADGKGVGGSRVRIPLTWALH